jgi:CDP-paratose 2-epimerase
MLEAIGMCEEISGTKLDYTYKEDNRTGDHIWYVSDVSKFKNHFPEWKLTKDVKTILTEIHTYNVDRWKEPVA